MTIASEFHSALSEQTTQKGEKVGVYFAMGDRRQGRSLAARWGRAWRRRDH